MALLFSRGPRSSRPMKPCFCRWPSQARLTSPLWPQSVLVSAPFEEDPRMAPERTTRINSAASTQPFAKDRSRGNEPAVMFFHPPGQGIDLTGGTHADGDDAGQQAGGNSEPGALGDIVHPADNLDTVAGSSCEPFQQIGQRLRGPLDPGRDDTTGNHSRLEQAQVVAGKIEDLRNGRNVRRNAQIDTGHRSEE